jgi:hypothetical protein
MKTPKTPQVIVTFSPTGQLQAEVYGPNGSRQVIPMPDDQAAGLLHRLLKGQALDQAAEAWTTIQASRNHRSYDRQLDELYNLRVEQARRRYTLVESQVGLLPQVKTTKAPKQSKPQVINCPNLHLGDDL